MILRRLGRLNKNQRGFTLIELLVALAITGLLASGLGMTIFQIFSGNAQSSSQMTVVRQVQNAGYWISQDTLMAQRVEVDADPSGFPLTLTWADWDTGDVHQVVYSLSVDNELMRTYSINGALNATTFVAQYIISIQATQGAGGKLTLEVTASVEGYRPANETRTYEIIPRANT